MMSTLMSKLSDLIQLPVTSFEIQSNIHFILDCSAPYTVYLVVVLKKYTVIQSCQNKCKDNIPIRDFQ